MIGDRSNLDALKTTERRGSGQATSVDGVPTTGDAPELSQLRGANDLRAIEALSATPGLLAKTGADAWAVRTITGDTEIVVANGSGSAGNPTLSIGAAIARDAEVTAAIAALNLASGVYTPTLTNAANLDASTAYECQYLRVGSVVHVSGKVDVDPTLAATVTQLGISLPIASNLGAEEDCAGAAAASGIAGQSAAIRGDAANDRAEMVWRSGDVTNQPMFFAFTYSVI